MLRSLHLTGISQASVVENEDQLSKRVQFVHESIGTAAIVEQFIDGRELYVGVIGTHSRRTYLKRVPRKKADLPNKEV